jgi:acetyl-CoA acetyltransferase family protein
VKAGGVFSTQSFLDLGIHAVNSLVKRLSLDPQRIDELIFGTVLLDPRLPNYARELVLRSGLPKSLGAHAISNNCISGLVALNMVAESIRVGRVKVGIAAGSESMSRPTLTLHPKAEALFLALARARSLSERIKILSAFRLKYVLPQPPSPKEPSTGLTMGQHCELSAKEFQITREQQDAIALRSHQNAAKAQKSGYLRDEIEPLLGVDADNLVRSDTTIEKLQKLKPVFDRSAAGTLTAGNSSALTDGASALCLMSEKEARAQGREILGFVECVKYSAIDPSYGLLMAPGLAVPELLSATQLGVKDVDIFEIHEAFAAQVAANRLIWEKGWSRFPQLKPIGAIPEDKINVNGGSIALGHPFAATGGRLVASTLSELKRRGGKRGVISVCAAGGMAAAVLLSRDGV